MDEQPRRTADAPEPARRRRWADISDERRRAAQAHFDQVQVDLASKVMQAFCRTWVARIPDHCEPRLAGDPNKLPVYIRSEDLAPELHDCFSSFGGWHQLGWARGLAAIAELVALELILLDPDHETALMHPRLQEVRIERIVLADQKFGHVYRTWGDMAAALVRVGYDREPAREADLGNVRLVVDAFAQRPVVPPNWLRRGQSAPNVGLDGSIEPDYPPEPPLWRRLGFVNEAAFRQQAIVERA